MKIQIQSEILGPKFVSREAVYTVNSKRFVSAPKRHISPEAPGSGCGPLRSYSSQQQQQHLRFICMTIKHYSIAKA